MSEVRTAWTSVWVVFAAGLGAGAYVCKVPPALPLLRTDLALTLVQSGFIATTFYVMGGVVGVFVGAVVDRYGQKRLALVGLALMSAGGVAGVFSHNFPELLITRFLEGIGFMLFIVAGAPLLTAVTTERDRPMAFSLWSAYMPTGGALALIAAPLALATFGWRSLWLGIAAYTALMAILLARTVPAPRFGGGIGSMRLVAESITRPGSLALCIVFICYVGQWSSLMIWLPTFLVDERGATSAAASLLTALFVAINVPGNLAGGWALKRGHARWRVITFSSAFMAVTAACALGSSLPDSLRVTSVLLFSLVGGMIPAAVLSGGPVHARSPQHIGTAQGMIMQGAQIGQFFGPMLVAIAAQGLGGWSASLGIMLGFAAMAAAAGIMVGRYERQLAQPHVFPAR